MKNILIIVFILVVGAGAYYLSSSQIKSLSDYSSEQDLIIRQQIIDSKEEVLKIANDVEQLQKQNPSNIDIKLAETQREIQKKNKDLEDFLLKKIIEVENSIDVIKKELKNEDSKFKIKEETKIQEEEVKEIKENNPPKETVQASGKEVVEVLEVPCYDRDDVKSCIKTANEKCSSYTNVDTALNVSLDNMTQIECSSYHIDTKCASKYCF